MEKDPNWMIRFFSSLIELNEKTDGMVENTAIAINAGIMILSAVSIICLINDKLNSKAMGEPSR